MKLDACYIAGFGMLCEKEIRFHDGLNVFCEENGAGKTTLAGFIKCMLYGLSDNKKHSVTENERKRFAPRSGGMYGGSLTFYAQGHHYRVERSFGKRPSEDTYALYDADTGKPVTHPQDPIGLSLLGPDADGFERVFYLSERELTGKNEVIGSLLSEGERIGLSEGLSAAVSRLDEARRRLERRGGGGSIPEGEDTIARLDAEIAVLRTESDRLPQYDEELFALEARLQAPSEHSAELLRASADQLRRKHSDLQAESAALSVFFRAGIPTAQEISAAEHAALRQKSAPRPRDTFRRRLRAPLLLLLAAIAALGLAIGLSESPAGYLLFLPLFAYILFLVSKKRNSSLHNMQNPQDFLTRYPCKTSYPFEEIRKNLYRFDEVQKELSEAEGRLAALAAQTEVPSLSSLYERRAILLTAIQKAKEAAIALEKKESERAAAQAKYDADRHTLFLLQKTKEHLLRADESLSGRYLDRITSSLARYAGLLGAKALPSADADLALFTSQGGQTYSADTASRGERTLYRLALRLALADALTGNEPPFFLLDDPFLAMDDVRIGRALALLRELAQERQLLYLTCSSSRAP